MYHVPAHKAVQFPAAQIAHIGPALPYAAAVLAVTEEDFRNRDARLNPDRVTVRDGVIVPVENLQPSMADGYPIYQRAYAQHYPLMKARWAAQKSRSVLLAARADVYAAMKACSHDPAYVGKSYAELDAISDRERAIRRRNK